MESMNIEKTLADWLGSFLLVPVYSDIPKDRPPSFVVVERTGGSRDSVVIDRPTVAIQCFAETRSQAAALAYEVDALIPDLVEVGGITKASRNSLYNWPDMAGAKSRPRYQIVIDLVTTF